MKAIFSDESLDSYNDIIIIGGVDLERYSKNPVLLYQHCSWSAPIGKVTNIRKEDSKLTGEVIFSENEEGKKIKDLYENGFMSGFSVGLKVIERQDNKIVKSELFEISAVTIPANANALAQSQKSNEGNNLVYKSIDFKTSMEGKKDDNNNEGILLELKKLNAKIEEIEKEIALQKSNGLNTNSLSEFLKAYKSEPQQIQDSRKEWSMTDWQKKDPSGLKKMKEQEPEKFKDLLETLKRK